MVVNADDTLLRSLNAAALRHRAEQKTNYFS